MRFSQGFDKPGNKLNLYTLPLLFALLGSLFAPVAFAEDDASRVNKVKAAFVLNVARFVTWPAEAFASDDAAMMLCYYRNNPFADGLDSIKDRTVSSRRLKFKQLDVLSEAKLCHILLVPQAELKRFATEVEPAFMQSLLTVVDRTHDEADSADPAETSVSPKGIIISLIRDGSRIGFEVDLIRSRAVGLKMNSQMVKHARVVNGG